MRTVQYTNVQYTNVQYTNLDYTNNKVSFISGAIMKIPEGLRIPAVVFGLEAIMLTGLALVFIVLVPY